MRAEVRPNTEGSTFSRPRAKMYRAVVLWKAIMQAMLLVTNSTEPTVATVPPRCSPAWLKMSAGPCSFAALTIPSGPVGTVWAQAEIE